MNIRSAFLLSVLLVSSLALSGQGLLERLGFPQKKAAETVAASGKLTSLTADEMANGLREALSKGVERAVAKLGVTNGFLQDQTVKIPLPEDLKRVEKTLRRLQQDALADEFVITMNRAAEQAVPQAAAVLADSVRQMTLTDAESILSGATNAATAYFRRTSETNLYARFYPIVQKATAATGATAAYKQLTEKVSVFGSLFGGGFVDLDAYVTQKTLDGLFLKISEEEARIRQNPAARTTELLQKVFGAAGKP